jgi:excisionase family DNA binding protein
MEMRVINSEVKLVGINDAAKFLSISTSTLYSWVWQRRIPFVKIGRAVRFDIGDLEQFIQKNRRCAKQS